ncbi:MAG: CoA-binding protein [Thermodesulfobacteriota bacterium]|nr:CoA-binding protein [Thermodesulfobacteriota bacterium]
MAKRGLDLLFNPRSIAVIGASNTLMKWGFLVFHNMVRGGYKGRLYPINPKEKKVFGVKAYPTVKSVGRELDLAVVIVPAPVVSQTLMECADAGVKYAVIISGGFGETGAEGKALQEEMVNVARNNGMRLVGPNTMGMYSSTSNLTLLMPPIPLRPGNIGFLSESGNLGTTMMQSAIINGLGFSRYVSVGNQADLKIYEFMEYFVDDKETDAILVYGEGLEEGRDFLDVAKKLTKKKPVVVYKSGKSEAGKKAAASHVGAMVGSDRLFDSAFKQAGVTRADHSFEMVDIVSVLSRQPLPKGRRIGILTYGGGWGVIASDFCGMYNLEVPPLPSEVIEEMNTFMPPHWSRGNPIDTVGTLDITIFRKAVETVLECDEIDGLLVLGIGGYSFFIHYYRSFSLLTNQQLSLMKTILCDAEAQIAKDLINFIEKYNKPIIVTSIADVVMSEAARILEDSGIVNIPSPERAAKAMASLVDYAEYLRDSKMKER